jgi:hypothetical protein
MFLGEKGTWFHPWTLSLQVANLDFLGNFGKFSPKNTGMNGMVFMPTQ